MNGITTNSGGAEVDAALVQIAKVKDTAEHLAKDDAPPGADQFRVIAGLVHQLAEHVERIVAASGQPPIPGAEGYPEDRHDAEVRLEEDRTPDVAPAEPLNDRSQ
jgi:hypothetical protein